MKLIKIILIAGLFVIAQTNKGYAQENLPSPVIAVLDLQQILKDSTAAQDIKKQADGLRKKYQSDIEKKEKDLRQKEQELVSQRGVLAPEEFNRKQQDFKKQVSEVQRDVQGKRTRLEQGLGKAMNEVQREIAEITSKIAEKNKITIVLRRSQVYLATREIDITEEISKQLNKNLTKVKVEVTGK